MSYRHNAKRRPNAGHRRKRLAFDSAVNARPSPMPTKARWTQSRCRQQARERTAVSRALSERTMRGLRGLRGWQ